MRVLAFDLGGTRLKAAVVEHGRPGALQVAEPSSLETAAEVGRRLLPADVVAMCVPGLVDEAGVVQLLPGKLPGVEGTDLRAWLGDVFRLPVGAVVNDAAAFGWAEAATRPGRRVLTVTVGTGLGTALVDGGAVRGLLTGQAFEGPRIRTPGGLAEALAAMCFAHEPDVVAVGGGGAPPLEGLEEAVNERLAPWLKVAVEPAGSGDAGGVIGVALLAERA